MDRLCANGTVNAAEAGKGPPLFLFHSLLSDRASFDAIAPRACEIVPRDRSGIAGLRPFAGRRRRACRCRRPHGGSGEGCVRRTGGNRARQRLWRLRRAADGDPPSRHRGAVRLCRLRRGLFRARPRGLPQHGGGLKGQGAGRDHRCRDAPAVRAGIPGAASGPDGGPPRRIPAGRTKMYSAPPARSLPSSICGESFTR